MGVCSAYNTITFNAREGDLYGDVLVGQTYNQTIFGCIVFVLVLEDQTFAGIVIGFTLTTPAEFDLVALEVLLVLDYFDETLKIAEDRKTKRSFSKQKTTNHNFFQFCSEDGNTTSELRITTQFICSRLSHFFFNIIGSFVFTIYCTF